MQLQRQSFGRREGKGEGRVEAMDGIGKKVRREEEWWWSSFPGRERARAVEEEVVIWGLIQKKMHRRV